MEKSLILVQQISTTIMNLLICIIAICDEDINSPS